MISAIQSRLRLWRARHVGAGVRVVGKIWTRGRGTLVIGDRVVFDGHDYPIDLYVAPGARLVIGDDVVIRGGSSISSTHCVTIGDGARIEPFCTIMDTNWHPLRFDGGGRDSRILAASVPVAIGDRVVLGRKVIVLSGVSVGADTTVLERSVVARPLPANVTVQGYPPRPVRPKSESHRAEEVAL